MIKQFEILTNEEATLLLKAPVIVSLQALSAYKEITRAQKEEAIKLAHVKTFTEHDILVPYYEAVDAHFKKYFEEYIEKYFPFDTAHCVALKSEMDRVNAVIDKLDRLFGGLLRKSLLGYARHMNNTSHHVLQDIIFPVTFSKL
jgi:hypothetical protein